ncbi:ribonuclease H-like domain-containing protein [Tanacetum coccineum]
MSRKGVKFSGKITLLFDSMLVPHQAPAGEGSEQPSKPQLTPSPTHPSTGDQPPVTASSSSHDTTQDSRDSLEGTNRSQGDQDAQAAKILKLKDQIEKLKRKSSSQRGSYEEIAANYKWKKERCIQLKKDQVPDEDEEIDYEVSRQELMEDQGYNARLLSTEMVSSLRTMFEANAEDDLWKNQGGMDSSEIETILRYCWCSYLGARRWGVSTEDANQKFLRSLPSSWSQVSLVMRTKPGVDSLSIDDLYNNLRVFESDIKGSTGSSSSAQNVAFVSSESTSSTNDVSTAYGVSTSSGYNSQRENSSSYTDELMYSFFANQSSGPHLDHEDLEQLDEFDLEEMDLKWQVAMISMRLKKFYKKTGRKLHFDAKEPVRFDKTKVECYNCHKKGHFARECRSKGDTGYKLKDNGRRPGK